MCRRVPEFRHGPLLVMFIQFLTRPRGGEQGDPLTPPNDSICVLKSAALHVSQTPPPPCGFRSGISFVTALTFLCARFIGKGNEAVVVCNRTIHLSSGMRKYFSYMRSGDEKFVAVLFACTFQSHAHSE